MRKILSCIVALMLIFSLVPTVFAAGTGTVSVTASSSNVTVGSQVSFTIKFTGSEIGSYQYSLQYDPAVLEYVGFSGDGEGNGTSGLVTAAGFFDQVVGSITTTVTFRAKTVGSANVTLTDKRVVDTNYQYLTISGTSSASVTVAAKPEASTDNTLKALTISPGTMAPAFSSVITEYTAMVDYATSKLVVSATPNDSKARVSISGTDLAVGENTVTIVCTAESGAQKTYIIKVTRKASDYAGVTVNVDGQSYTAGFDVNSMPVPQGYTRGESDIGGRKMVSFTSPGGAITVVWLLDSQNNGAWFTYDAATGVFGKYQAVNTTSNLVLLDMPADIIIPEGFASEAVDVDILGVTAKAYAATESADFYLVYALGANGEKGLYIYDQAQGTMQRYFTAGSVQVIAPVENETPKDDTQNNQPAKEIPTTRYVVIGAAALLFICGVVTLILVLRRPEDKNEDNE